jgi:hypothetical protein
MAPLAPNGDFVDGVSIFIFRMQKIRTKILGKWATS